MASDNVSIQVALDYVEEVTKAKECLEAIKTLMRENPRIRINEKDQWYIETMSQTEGYVLASEIMRILYPQTSNQKVKT